MVEECLNLCYRYLHGVYIPDLIEDHKTMMIVLQLMSKHVVCSLTKGCPLRGKKGGPNVDDKSLSQAHIYILNNYDEIQNYVR